MLQQPLPDYPLHPIGLSIHPVLFFFPAVKLSNSVYLYSDNLPSGHLPTDFPTLFREE